MLEKMGEFFDDRLDDYEEHQLTCIDSAQEFYPFTASCLPQTSDRVLLPLKRFPRDELLTVPRLIEPEPRLEDTDP